MPKTLVYFYKEKDTGQAVVVEWLKKLKGQNPKAYAKCVAIIDMLEDEGHAMRRPQADMLREGIYELRVRQGTVNFRLLYFFYGQNVAILAHALTKEREVPDRDINLAIKRRAALQANPKSHIYIVSDKEEEKA